MKHTTSKLLGELIVPVLAAGFLAVYWWQTIGLSAKAQAFPSMVTIGAALTILWLSYSAVKTYLTSDQPEAPPAVEAPLIGPTAQRAGLVIIVALVMAAWREIGATIGIFVFLLTSLFILGERRPLMLFAFPIILTVLLAYLFQVVLTVIFPSGFFSLF